MMQFAKKVCRVLVKDGKLELDDATALLEEAVKTKESLTDLLVKKDIISEGSLLASIARTANLPPIDQNTMRFHGDEGDTIGFIDLVDDGDVRMMKCRCGLGFLYETTASFGIRNELRRKNLDRDFPVELGVQRAVDDSHAAAADLRQDPVVRKGPPDHQGLLFSATILW